MQRLLEQCRRNFGPPGRHFSLWDRLTYLRIGRPAWCDRSDGFGVFFNEKHYLLSHGDVVWGHVVQANDVLFRWGLVDSAAAFVYAADPHEVVDPDALADAAERLFALRETTPSDPELAPIAEFLADEWARPFGVAVPRSVCPQLGAQISASLVIRRHLPRRRLCGLLLPILLSPREPKVILPLPSRWWPEELVAWWSEQE